MEIIIPEFYIFMAGIIILILMMLVCFYYFWIRRTKIMPQPNALTSTTSNELLDLKEGPRAILKTKMGTMDYFMYEDERGFHFTNDSNLSTKYRYHDRESPLLKNLKIQIPLLTKKTMALDSSNSILEVRYLDTNKVNIILRYQKDIGYIIRYFHLNSGKVILDNNSNDQIIFEIENISK